MREAIRPTILSISPDFGILLSRTQILRSAGYEVIAALNRHVAVLAAANHAVDLALVCHAFPTDESESLEHDLRTVHPGVAVLQLHDFDSLQMREDGLGPQMLLQMVKAALSQRVR